MTKKEVYYLAVEVAGASLRGYFQMGRADKSFNLKYFQMPRGKPIVKAVYDALASQLVTDEVPADEGSSLPKKES